VLVTNTEWLWVRDSYCRNGTLHSRKVADAGVAVVRDLLLVNCALTCLERINIELQQRIKNNSHRFNFGGSLFNVSSVQSNCRLLDLGKSHVNWVFHIWEHSCIKNRDFRLLTLQLRRKVSLHIVLKALKLNWINLEDLVDDPVGYCDRRQVINNYILKSCCLPSAIRKSVDHVNLDRFGELSNADSYEVLGDFLEDTVKLEPHWDCVMRSKRDSVVLVHRVDTFAAKGRQLTELYYRVLWSLPNAIPQHGHWERRIVHQTSSLESANIIEHFSCHISHLASSDFWLVVSKS
jgi:hypothetical protein